MSQTAQPKNILLVDDEPFILNVMLSFLDPHAYTIDTAKCGMDAFELVKQKKYDCIVSDVRMPNGTGTELLTNIRETVGRDPPLVFVTGYSDTPPEDLMARGADSFILKPFNVEDFSMEVGRMSAPFQERLAKKPASYEALKLLTLPTAGLLKSGTSESAHLGRCGFFTSRPPDGVRTNQSYRFAMDLGDGKSLKGSGRVLWVRRPSSLNPFSPGAGFLIEYLDADSLDPYLRFLESKNPFETIPKDLV